MKTDNKKDGKERSIIQLNSYHRLLSYPFFFLSLFLFWAFLLSRHSHVNYKCTIINHFAYFPLFLRMLLQNNIHLFIN